MKELSIEEKARAYDEALKKAKDMLSYKEVRREDMEYLFPELKESDDEKIRKALIRFHKSTIDIDGIKGEDILAWLEKQGEQKSIDDLTSQEVMDIAVAKCFEQGKQNPDKVEPKFKIEEGKWYVCTQTFVLRGKIVVIKGSTYQAREDNAICGEDGCLFIDKHDGKVSEYFHPWTIQDIKDGDILFTSSTASHETFIFKSIDENNNTECYFSYDSEDGFREGKYHFIGSITNCKPATKKQCDLLFKKMKEAGYEWDSEKKELEKIEKKFADNIIR